MIHVGIEGSASSQIAAVRHFRNLLEAKKFFPKTSRLRWVYGNYFMPELTTRPDETWAFTETSVPYKIGSHRVKWPLPDHLLVSSEERLHDGMHWDGR